MKVLALSALTLSAAAAIGGMALLSSPTASSAAAAQKADGVFTVDPVHSTLVFKIKHQEVAWFQGRFNGPTGTFNIDPADPSKSIVDVSIAVENVDTGNKKRDDHLKSGDFFSAKEYPTITFKGKSFKKSGEHAVEVTGDLTVHGVTKPLTATVELTGQKQGDKGAIAGAYTTFMLKRSDFGMNFMVGPLGDDVTLMVSLEGGKK